MEGLLKEDFVEIGTAEARLKRTGLPDVVLSAVQARLGGPCATAERCATAAQEVFAPSSTDSFARLTDIQLTISRLVAAGQTNRQIARQVYLTPHTINFHLREIFRKLDISSRVELAGLYSSAMARSTVCDQPCLGRADRPAQRVIGSS